MRATCLIPRRSRRSYTRYSRPASCSIVAPREHLPSAEVTRGWRPSLVEPPPDCRRAPVAPAVNRGHAEGRSDLKKGRRTDEYGDSTQKWTGSRWIASVCQPGRERRSKGAVE